MHAAPATVSTDSAPPESVGLAQWRAVMELSDEDVLREQLARVCAQSAAATGPEGRAATSVEQTTPKTTDSITGGRASASARRPGARGSNVRSRAEAVARRRGLADGTAKHSGLPSQCRGRCCTRAVARVATAAAASRALRTAARRGRSCCRPPRTPRRRT